MSHATVVSIVHDDGRNPTARSARLESHVLTEEVSSQRRDLAEALCEIPAFEEAEEVQGQLPFDVGTLMGVAMADPCFVGGVEVDRSTYERLLRLRESIGELQGRGRSVMAFVGIE